MRVLRALVALTLALAIGACVRPRPEVVGEPAVLQVPSPPPRVIVPPEPEPEPDLAADEVEKNEPNPPRRSAPPRVVPPPKAEEIPAAPAEPPKQLPAVAPAAGTLQPVLPKDVEEKVREQLKRADSYLSKVYYQGLSTDAKAQYDMAKNFSKQAEQALVDRNLVFAGKLAEKAANIAAVLAGR